MKRRASRDEGLEVLLVPGFLHWEQRLLMGEGLPDRWGGTVHNVLRPRQVAEFRWFAQQEVAVALPRGAALLAARAGLGATAGVLGASLLPEVSLLASLLNAWWSLYRERARLAAEALREELLARKGKRRTVLVAHSLGCDVVLRALQGAPEPLAEGVVLVAGAVEADRAEALLPEAAEAVRGSVQVLFHRQDAVLKVFSLRHGGCGVLGRGETARLGCAGWHDVSRFVRGGWLAAHCDHHVAPGFRRAVRRAPRPLAEARR